MSKVDKNRKSVIIQADFFDIDSVPFRSSIFIAFFDDKEKAFGRKKPSSG